MSQKRVLPLVLILVVLIAIAWALGFFGGSTSTIETPDVEISRAEVTSITIRKGDDELVVVRSADRGWQLEAPVVAPADSGASRTLLNQLENFAVESLVSSQPERYGLFQVDSAQATYLRIDAGEPLEMWVGKTGPDFQSRYVRFGGDERVFLAHGVPTGDPDPDRWRDKQLWSFPRASIQSVAVTRPDESYRLIADTQGWNVVAPDRQNRPDSTEVRRYLDRLSTVKADGFLMDADPEVVADSISHSVEVTLVDGTTARLDIAERDSDAAALVTGSGVAHETDDVVKLFTYRVRSLAPNSSEMLPDED